MVQSSLPGFSYFMKEPSINLTTDMPLPQHTASSLEIGTTNSTNKILIVDDELITRSLLKKILESSGYDC